jgi:hypothetical protein
MGVKHSPRKFHGFLIELHNFFIDFCYTLRRISADCRSPTVNLFADLGLAASAFRILVTN